MFSPKKPVKLLPVTNFFIQADAAQIAHEETLKALEAQGYEVIRHTMNDASVIIPKAQTKEM